MKVYASLLICLALVEHTKVQLRKESAHHPVEVFVDEVPVLLQDLMQSGLDAVLAAAQRVAVVVQQPVHVGALHHLHQDGCQFTLQSQQTLHTHTHAHT